MTRLLHLVLLLALLLTTTPVTAPAFAQEAQGTTQEAAPAIIPGLAVARNEATAEFPNGITFSLDAETDSPVASLELVYTPVGRETLSAELPPITAGTTDLSVEHPIDLRTGQIPPGVDIAYHWRITEEDGDVVQTPDQTVLWSDNRFDWTPLEGPNVTVYTYDGDTAHQQEILDAAERTITGLGDAYDAELADRVRIWSYGKRQDYQSAQAVNSEPWTAGGTYPALHIINVVLAPGDLSEVQRVVPHEISHQMLYEATKNPFNSPPGWLDEGLAVYWQESGRDRMYSYALELAATQDIPPLRTLNGDFGYDGGGALAAYSLSLTAVMYILDTWGDEGMARLLATFDEGVTYEDAIQQGLGISFDELDRQWRADLAEDARNLGAAGTTRFGDSGPDLPSLGSQLERGILLASGTLILGLFVLIAVAAGIVALLRSRRRSAGDDEESDSLTWRDWPEGLEPPRPGLTPLPGSRVGPGEGAHA